MNQKKVQKKVGRPAIGKPRSIRVSDAEWDECKRRARQAGMVFASWIRRQLLRQ